MTIEITILQNLVTNDEYTRKVLPFIKEEYFSDRSQKQVFNTIKSYVEKYNNLPTLEALIIDIESQPAAEGYFEETLEVVKEIDSLKNEPKNSIDWLTDSTEKFCQDRAIYNALLDSIQIADGKNQKLDKGAIPKILSDALAVCFSSNIGHNYIDDSDERYEYYHRVENRIPFAIKKLNQVTRGGFPRKTLNMIIAGVNVGKTLAMCSLSTDWLMLGQNVLYITCEMAENEIAKRIDANSMNITIDELMSLEKEVFDKKIAKLKKMTVGKLVIKEYAPGAASANTFRNLLDDLDLKQNFVPDVIVVDYLNLVASCRVKMGGNINGYGYVKAVAEELRGLAVERNVAMLSATQLNRTGMESSDPEMTDTSESMGTPMTVDWQVALIDSEELKALNQIMFKQQKSRYSNKDESTRFVLGIDRAKMKLYDADSDDIYKQKEISSKPDFSKKDKFKSINV